MYHIKICITYIMHIIDEPTLTIQVRMPTSLPGINRVSPTSGKHITDM